MFVVSRSVSVDEVGGTLSPLVLKNDAIVYATFIKRLNNILKNSHCIIQGEIEQVGIHNSSIGTYSCELRAQIFRGTSKDNSGYIPGEAIQQAWHLNGDHDE